MTYGTYQNKKMPDEVIIRNTPYDIKEYTQGIKCPSHGQQNKAFW